MHAQVGLDGLIDRVKREAPRWAQTLPQLPRLLHAVLSQSGQAPVSREQERMIERLLREQRRQQTWLRLLSLLVLLMLALALWQAR